MADPPARNSGKWSTKHQERAKKAGFKTYLAWIKYLETHTTTGTALRGGRRKICGAWRSSAAHPCCRTAGYGTDHKGAGRCNECFGNNPWGSEAPAYRGKGYSRFLPDDLRARYDELEDADLTNVSEEIRLATVRHGELMSRFGDGTGTEAWSSVTSIHTKLLAAAKKSDAASLIAAIQDLGTVAEGRESRDAVWRQMQENSEHMARLVAVQTNVFKVAGEFMHRKTVLTLVAQIADDINELVEDPAQRQALRGRMRGYLGTPIRIVS